MFGHGLAQGGRVLDWGVGCGRIARHLLAADPDADLVGCDIDRDNVEWCAGHLPGGRFVPSDLRPPLPFPDGHFQVVYGGRFTHLRAPLEALWLEELRRVLSPGGIALVTVHGATALEFMALAPDQWLTMRDRIDDEGLVESSPNSQLVGFVPNPEEYVNVFHSRRHITRSWRRHFDIVRILPGYVFTHDLVVVRRR
ncbi:MAG: class I SAM-dependent methyltransferase [Betaproteobacteria bacterium]|nr:class I SAM-dependent methyltransferase [Betaproteobacteria bacterium]